MATLVRMPQKGLSEETALLSKWYVKKGDEVKAGQYLFALETGKATFDVEAEVSGTVLELIGNEGDEVAVTAVVCVIGTPGESYSLDPAGSSVGAASPADASRETPGAVAPPKPAPAPATAAAPSAPAAAPSMPAAGSAAATAPAAPAAAAQGASAAAPTSAGPSVAPGRIRVSPRARRLAERSGISLEAVAGSGPGGRIIEDDVQAILRARPAGVAGGAAAPGVMAAGPAPAGAGEYTAVPNDRMRKTIAVNMLRSLQGMAQFTMGAGFDATELLSYRTRYNEVNPEEHKLSINDLILFAVSRVVLDFPFMNAHYFEEETRRFVHASIGVAVDTPRGLLVPTVKMADELSLAEISARVKDLAARCRDGKASADELSGGTFTITNLGAAGVDFFTPVINPPQTAILGVGGIDYKRKKTAQGMEDYPAISLSLTVDHRAVDGAPAARFLQTLVRELENFPLLLVK